MTGEVEDLIEEIPHSLWVTPSMQAFFDSKEEKEEYVRAEAIACQHEIRALAAAFIPEERKAAKIALHEARLRFYERQSNRRNQASVSYRTTPSYNKDGDKNDA